MSPRSRPLLLLAAATTLAAGACIDLGRTVDSTGTLAAQLDARDGDASVARAAVKGPARLRRLSDQTWLAAARFLRPDPAGMRRGDLFLRVRAPHALGSATRFYGDIRDFTASYVELRESSGVRETFAGSGAVRLDYIPAAGGGGDSVQVAFELQLRPLAAPTGPRFLRLRGVLATSGGRTPSNDLGAGLWVESFDVVATLASPDYDLYGYLADPETESGWVLEASSDAPAGFGFFDFGAGGEVSAIDTASGADAVDSASAGDPSGPGSTTTGLPDPGQGSGTTFDDDADGGCQGDKASQDTSECGSLRASPRGLGFVTVLATLGLAKLVRRRRR